MYAAAATDRVAVSVNEVVRLTGLGRTRIYQAIGDGELPSIKLGRRRLIRLSAIEDWLAKHEER